MDTHPSTIGQTSVLVRVGSSIIVRGFVQCPGEGAWSFVIYRYFQDHLGNNFSAVVPALCSIVRKKPLISTHSMCISLSHIHIIQLL